MPERQQPFPAGEVVGLEDGSCPALRRPLRLWLQTICWSIGEMTGWPSSTHLVGSRIGDGQGRKPVRDRQHLRTESMLASNYLCHSFQLIHLYKIFAGLTDRHDENCRPTSQRIASIFILFGFLRIKSKRDHDVADWPLLSLCML